MRILNFILSHSIFIAFCSGALVYQSYLLLNLPFRPEVFGLVFFATLAAYNTYWMLCKLSNDNKEKRVLTFNAYSGYFILFVASVIAVLDYLWQMPSFFPMVTIASILTFLYLLPVISSVKYRLNKNIGFIKTLLLAFTWSFFTVLIPAYGEINAHLHHVVTLFLMRFFFMLMLCIIFDSRDVSIDKFRNLPSIATDVSKKTLTIIMMVVLGGYVFSLFGLHQFVYNSLYLFLLLSVGALTFIIYLLALKTRGYYFYYFLVDGLMILSALSLYMATI
jgi:4-hydroxybenzoate polyprenyltransferase